MNCNAWIPVYCLTTGNDKKKGRSGWGGGEGGDLKVEVGHDTTNLLLGVTHDSLCQVNRVKAGRGGGINIHGGA